MAITRSQMRRQLYRGGGIATLPRQGYGIGSWVKERIRKIIPNEIADFASKAAPFVAPFYPGAAAAMRGIGRFDKRGSISDAMKQAALTYAGGEAARYLGGATGGEFKLVIPGTPIFLANPLNLLNIPSFLAASANLGSTFPSP